MHRRRDDKDIWPGRWDLAAGGVLAQGETYDDGAARELAEELGITGVPLLALGQGCYDDADVSEIAGVYTVTWDSLVRFVDGEVVEAHWVTPAGLRRMVAELDFVPDSVALVLGYV